jgi:hypothetical protein
MEINEGMRTHSFNIENMNTDITKSDVINILNNWTL